MAICFEYQFFSVTNDFDGWFYGTRSRWPMICRGMGNASGLDKWNFSMPSGWNRTTNEKSVGTFGKFAIFVSSVCRHSSAPKMAIMALAPVENRLHEHGTHTHTHKRIITKITIWQQMTFSFCPRKLCSFIIAFMQFLSVIFSRYFLHQTQNGEKTNSTNFSARQISQRKKSN